MGMSRGLLEEAFGSPAWRETADAVHAALGIGISVVEGATGAVVYDGERNDVCERLSRSGSRTPTTCIAPIPHAGARPEPCPIGLSRIHAPLVLDGECVAVVVLGGFVPSRAALRRLQDELAARDGIPPASLAKTMRGVPVLPPTRADGALRLVAGRAAEVLHYEIGRAKRERRMRELETVAAAARGFSQVLEADGPLPECVLGRALAITGAVGGSLSLSRPGTPLLDVAADSGRHAGRTAGARYQTGEGVPGTVAQSRRILVGAGGPDAPVAGEQLTRRATVVGVPLLRGSRFLGVLMLTFPADAKTIDRETLRLVEALSEPAAAALDDMRRFGESQERLAELATLHEAAKALGAASDSDALIAEAVAIIDKALSFEVGGLLLSGGAGGRVVLHDDVGPAELAGVLGEAAGLEPEDGDVDRCVLLPLGGALSPEDPGFDSERWVVMSADVPLAGESSVTLFAASRAPGAFTLRDRRVLLALASHVSRSLATSRTLERVRTDLARTFEALTVALDRRDHYGDGHTQRVVDLAVAVGAELGMHGEELEVLRLAALVHDIGKIGVSEEILLKPAALTEDEMAEVRRHAQIGASVVEQMDFLRAVTPVVLHHHERWDGTGYPMRLAGQTIPLGARVLAVADAWGALTCDRSYRGALPPTVARVEVERGAGSQFDPSVVAAFLRVLDRRTTSARHGLQPGISFANDLPA